MSRRVLAAALVLAVASVAVSPALVGGESFVSMSATVAPDQPTVDDEFAVDVRLESADDSEELYVVRNVTVYDGPGDDADAIEYTESDATLTAGSTETVRVDELELDERGVHRLRAEATLVRSDGEVERTVETTFSTRVYAPDPLTEVDAASAVPGAWRPVNLTVANRLDESLRGVSVRVEGDAVEFAEAERVAAAIQGNGDRTFSFRARTDEAGVHDLTVSLSYEDPDGEVREVTRTTSADFTGPASPGEIQLTGVSATPAGDGVEVSGSASNVGGQPVSSVVVAVADAEGVEPIQPQPEFFVGSVDGSDFASFSVNARLEGNRTTVPLEVTYRVDGVERTATREVPYEGPSEPAEARGGDGGGGPPITLLVGAAVLLALVGLAWRFFR